MTPETAARMLLQFHEVARRMDDAIGTHPDGDALLHDWWTWRRNIDGALDARQYPSEDEWARLTAAEKHLLDAMTGGGGQ